MTITDVTNALAAVQSRVASLTAGPGGLPSQLQSEFSSVLSSLLNSTAGSSAAGTASPVSTAIGSLGGSPLLAGSAGTGGDSVVVDAAQYLGVPYRWGGTDPATGLDCSGLVQRTFADVGISLPRVAADQAKAGAAVPDLASARPGDLVAFGTPVDHIGIYAGNGKMIVAPHTGAPVRVEQISDTPTAIRRIQPVGTAAYPAFASLASATSSTPVAGTAGAATGPHADLFNAAGTRYGVDPRLLSAVAKAESGYRPGAVSGAGAQGLMQLMPSTAASLGVDALDPAQAVDGAARLLSGHLQRFGNVADALAAYNAGGGAVARYGGVPPYPETQAYVRRVLDLFAKESA